MGKSENNTEKDVDNLQHVEYIKALANSAARLRVDLIDLFGVEIAVYFDLNIRNIVNHLQSYMASTWLFDERHFKRNKNGERLARLYIIPIDKDTIGKPKSDYFSAILDIEITDDKGEVTISRFSRDF